MKKTLFAVAFSGLMAVGMAGCGGGGDSTSDIINDMCKRMDTCGYLSSAGMTLSQCKQMAGSEGGEASAAQKDAARACLAKASCEEFAACIADM